MVRPTDRREQGWGSWEALFRFLSGERRDGGCAGCATGRLFGAVAAAVGRSVVQPAQMRFPVCVGSGGVFRQIDGELGAPSLSSRFAPSLPPSPAATLSQT